MDVASRLLNALLRNPYAEVRIQYTVQDDGPYEYEGPLVDVVEGDGKILLRSKSYIDPNVNLVLSLLKP